MYRSCSLVPRLYARQLHSPSLAEGVRYLHSHWKLHWAYARLVTKNRYCARREMRVVQRGHYCLLCDTPAARTSMLGCSAAGRYPRCGPVRDTGKAIEIAIVIPFMRTTMKMHHQNRLLKRRTVLRRLRLSGIFLYDGYSFGRAFRSILLRTSFKTSCCDLTA